MLLAIGFEVGNKSFFYFFFAGGFLIKGFVP